MRAAALSCRVPLVLALALAALPLLAPALARATVSFPEFRDPHPADGNNFGATVQPLASGNVVVTSPNDNANGLHTGAVYLFNGTTGALVSTLKGSSIEDRIGSGGVVALPGGNFLVLSPLWDNGSAADAGAVTFGNGSTGVSGSVSSANSLVGDAGADQIGSYGAVVLTNGNYVVESPYWDNGATVDAGAVTWGSGTTGVKGVVSSANSLVGTTANDVVGSAGVTALSNGNYVVASASWSNGAVTDVGAATWCNGTTGRTGTVTTLNSLVGTTAFDDVAGGGVTALTNGNYVVGSRGWHNASAVAVGAATWANGSTGLVGTVTAANSLVGSNASDLVGDQVVALTNGNYVAIASTWNNGATADVGAVTWCNGGTGRAGVVSAANSLVGTTVGDLAGAGNVVALTNGNYVVTSSYWDNGATADVGAVTWCSGTTGRAGAITTFNSLVGSTSGDLAGSRGVRALTNGNFIVSTSTWSNGGLGGAGAVTWGSGTSGIVGAVSAANSLVGSSASDNVGFYSPLVLSNGNYVVLSPAWHNGALAGAGAATWGSGTTGVKGTITSANSLVGTTAGDQVGNSGVALSNGNYVIGSGSVDIGAVSDAGAVTWGNGATGTTGVVSAANSVVGSQVLDRVASGGLVASTADAGWVALTPGWDNGTLATAGAVTYADGTGPVTGSPNIMNSVVGLASVTGLQSAWFNPVNGAFYAVFSVEGGGHVRAGPATPFALASAADIPADQGGAVRLTFSRSILDHDMGDPPIATYGVWRMLPGTGAQEAQSPDAASVAHLRELLPAGFGSSDGDGRLFASPNGAAAVLGTGTMPRGTWELVASVPATQQAQYIAAVSTISNAAPDTFVVTAHTTTPSIWFASNVLAGQSADNLAPAAPLLTSAGYAAGATHLAWAANTEHDLAGYNVYRGASALFTPAPGNRIATLQPGTSLADAGPAGSFYKLSAADVNGNESGFTLVTPSGTTDVPAVEPVAFALRGVHPNPASSRGVHVEFALPGGAPARLELLDVSGRQVLARQVGMLGAGRHSVNLAAERRLVAGIYWVRLTQGAQQRSARVAVVD